MLKFTAELSDQFRRASSLSSLKSYQQSKERTKQLPFANSSKNYAFYPSYGNQQKLDRHYLTYQDYQSCQPLQKHNFEGNNMWSQDRQSLKYSLISSKKSSNMRNHDARPKSYCNLVCQNYHTPHKKLNNQRNIKQSLNKSTINTQVVSHNFNEKSEILQPSKQYQNVCFNEATVKGNNQPILQRNYMSAFIGCRENFDNVQNNPQIKQRNNMQAAKLRISSYNTLQNIQRKIQSTLGYERSLKI